MANVEIISSGVQTTTFDLQNSVIPLHYSQVMQNIWANVSELLANFYSTLTHSKKDPPYPSLSKELFADKDPAKQ